MGPADGRPRAGSGPDDIAQFGGKLRVGAEFEDPQPMRGETMGVPDLLHGADRQPDGLGHRTARPMGGLAGRRAERERDQLRDDRLGDRRFAGLAGLVVEQAIDPGFDEAALPAPHAGF
jgi:hypothetical protein